MFLQVTERKQMCIRDRCCSALFRKTTLSTVVSYAVMGLVVIGTYGINQFAYYMSGMHVDSYFASIGQSPAHEMCIRDRSRSTHTGGTGLGLAIVKNIVDMHGGTITVKSDLNGTVFTVTLQVDFDINKENFGKLG